MKCKAGHKKNRSGLLSLPSWERGLKSKSAYKFSGHFRSLPSWERGLKFTRQLSQISILMSLPSWERGLKLSAEEWGAAISEVAPLVGAWVEIYKKGAIKSDGDRRSPRGSVG